MLKCEGSPCPLPERTRSTMSGTESGSSCELQSPTWNASEVNEGVWPCAHSFARVRPRAPPGALRPMPTVGSPRPPLVGPSGSPRHRARGSPPHGRAARNCATLGLAGRPGRRNDRGGAQPRSPLSHCGVPALVPPGGFGRARPRVHRMARGPSALAGRADMRLPGIGGCVGTTVYSDVASSDLVEAPRRVTRPLERTWGRLPKQTLHKAGQSPMTQVACRLPFSTPSVRTCCRHSSSLWGCPQSPPPDSAGGRPKGSAGSGVRGGDREFAHTRELEARTWTKPRASEPPRPLRAAARRRRTPRDAASPREPPRVVASPCHWPA